MYAQVPWKTKINIHTDFGLLVFTYICFLDICERQEEEVGKFINHMVKGKACSFHCACLQFLLCTFTNKEQKLLLDVPHFEKRHKKYPENLKLIRKKYLRMDSMTYSLEI